MSGRRWFASPLTGTLGVLAGLGLLAIPLHHLTSRELVKATPAPAAAPQRVEMPGVLRVRLLQPAARLVVKTSAGRVLINQSGLAAGETEYDVDFPAFDDLLEIQLEADLGAGETAVFLTILPDGRAERTGYVIGCGEVEDLLRFDWQTP